MTFGLAKSARSLSGLLSNQEHLGSLVGIRSTLQKYEFGQDHDVDNMTSSSKLCDFTWPVFSRPAFYNLFGKTTKIWYLQA